MENGYISRPIQALQNGSMGTGSGPKSAFVNCNGAPMERIVHISGPNKNLTDQERPDMKTITGGFIPIGQAHNPFPDPGRDYFLDSDLETIEEESSVLDSDLEDRSTPRNETSVLDSESSDELVNGDCSSPSVSSLSDSQLHSVSSVPATGNSISPKIVYAKCLSPHGHIQRNNAPSQQLEGPLIAPRKQASPAYGALSKTSAGDRRESEPTMSDMFQAVARGDLRTLRKFSPTEQSETLDERGNTLLHLAATAGQLHCIRFLLDGPLSDAISIPNDELLTPTALAVMRGHLSCVQWMVENTPAKKELIVSSRQASIDGSSMRPPLAHVAARYNQDQVLDWLCEQMVKEGYSVDSADHHSSTATHEAAAHGHLKALQVLVAKGASVTVLNSHGDTPGQVADKRGQDLCVGYLVVVETCMSLAQQLIRVKLENEGLVNDNNALKTQLQAMHYEKLAQAKESVEERIRVTLQSLSSHEDSEYHSDNHDTSKAETERSPLTSNTPKFASPKPIIDPVPAAKIVSPTSVASTNRQVIQAKENGTREVGKLRPQTTNITTTPPVVTIPEKTKFNSSELNGGGVSIAKSPTKSVPDGNLEKENKTIHETKTIRKFPSQSETYKERAQQVDGQPTKGEPEQRKPDISPVKAWEKMAMDDLLRLSRDSRYLPSPTISMCTEDSTMEPREAMRDQIAAASRWFLVQQSGGKAHLNDSKVSQRMRIANHGTNSFAKQQKSLTGNKPHAMVGPIIRQGTKTGPMPARIISTNASTSSEAAQQSQPGDKFRTIHSTTTLTPEKVASTSRPDRNGNSVSAYRNNQIGSIASIRPTSAKSNASSTSTLRSNSYDSHSSSPSTSLSDRSVIENTAKNTDNSEKMPFQHNAKNGMTEKRQSPASNSPASLMPSNLKSTNVSSKEHNSGYSAVPKLTPYRTQTGYQPSVMDTAQITVPLPTRNNSFLRKVQPPSPTHTPTRGRSPIKTNPVATSSVHSHPISPSKIVSPPPNSIQPTGANRGNFNGYAYYLPRSTPKDKQNQDTVTTTNSQTSPAVSPKKSPTKPPNVTHKSSNSPKISGKKKGTKLFRF